MRITFSVSGEPQGKGRPRFTARYGRAYVHTPEKTVIYENHIKAEYARQCKGQRFADDSQLAMRIAAYYAIPKSTSNKRRQQMLAGIIRPTKKPDADNVLKAIADALNGLAYRDDAQIIAAVIEKHYSEEPKVEIEINNV